MRKSLLTIFVLSLATFTANAQSNVWMQSNGPYGGFVNCIAETASGEILAGTQKGIFESSDLGQHWSRMPALRTEPIYGLATASDGTVLAGTGVDGIFYSRDNGATWNASTGLSGNYAYDLIRGPAGSYFTIATNVYKSTDGGANWFLSGSNSPTVDRICQDSSGNLYVANFGRFLMSTDQGNTWNAQLPGLIQTYCYSLAADKSGNLYATTDSLSWRSTDHGQTWTPMTAGSKSAPVLVISTASSEVYAAGAWDFYQSSDAGVTWSSTAFEGGQPTDILSLGNSQLLLTTLSGTLKSDDGGTTWASDVNGMTNTLIGPVIAKGSGDVVAAAAAVFGGVYYSSDNGGSWKEANLRASDYAPIASLVELASGAVLAATRGSGLFRTSNNAASWQQIGLSLPDSNILSLGVNGSEIVAGTVHAGAFLSMDSGNTWTKISNISDTEIRVAGADSSGNLYAVGASGNLYRSPGTGNGTWAVLARIQGYVSSMAIAKNGAIFLDVYNTSFAGLGVLRSTDQGASWDTVNAGLPDNNITSLTLDRDTLYATFSDTGIYRTTNSGASWESVNSGLTFRDVNSIAFSSNGYIFAGTYGDGVYRTGSLKAGVLSHHPLAVQTIAYPNPASDKLNFNFSAAIAGNATLRIFDLLGNERLFVHWIDLEAGNNERAIDVSSLWPGSYSYLITTGNNQMTGKITILK